MSAQSVEIRADHGLDAANAVESEFIPVEAVNPGAGRGSWPGKAASTG